MKKWSRHLLAAGALALGMSAAHADDNNTLYFYNWTEYVPPGLLEQFTKETGIKVIYSTYESNETMYAKLKTYKDGAYDLVVPSTYYVDKMRKEGMIQKIDKSKLTNFSNLDPDMLNKPFDPNNDYSIPYIWGATAIGVNGDAVDPKSVTSWADLWKPEYKGSLLLTDDAREVNHRTYGPTNWERINRFLFGSDSSFPNAAYNSPLYCALQVCLFSPSSLPW